MKESIFPKPNKPVEHIPGPGEFMPPIVTVHKNGKAKRLTEKEVEEFDWMVAFRKK